jgi:solute carrier family 6 amino acid transporter-like protein 5/7/9/14
MYLKICHFTRFPFTAFENGGATFIFVYIIILFLIGKPFYFLEMIIGQFTSSGSIRALEIIPLMKGSAHFQSHSRKNNQ